MAEEGTAPVLVLKTYLFLGTNRIILFSKIIALPTVNVKKDIL